VAIRPRRARDGFGPSPIDGRFIPGALEIDLANLERRRAELPADRKDALPRLEPLRSV